MWIWNTSQGASSASGMSPGSFWPSNPVSIASKCLQLIHVKHCSLYLPHVISLCLVVWSLKILSHYLAKFSIPFRSFLVNQFRCILCQHQYFLPQCDMQANFHFFITLCFLVLVPEFSNPCLHHDCYHFACKSLDCINSFLIPCAFD